MNVYEEIQAAIELAWATTDSETRQRQTELVGDTHTPTPEELIRIVAQKVRSKLLS